MRLEAAASGYSHIVVVHFKNGGVLRIGTDDAANLARFLEGKVAQQGT